MKKLVLWSALSIAYMLISILILTSQSFSVHAAAPIDTIYALKIENINRNGADFYWSTSIETKGTLEYSYTKLREIYNPQSPGSTQNVIISATPLLTITEDYYFKDHHIRVDNLDIDESPFVQYTIKSQAFNGETYTISGEFVLVDTKKINWWQTWQFAIFWSIAMIFLGLIIRQFIAKICNSLRSIITVKKG